MVSRSRIDIIVKLEIESCFTTLHVIAMHFMHEIIMGKIFTRACMDMFVR